jgi:hypothetical protein
MIPKAGWIPHSSSILVLVIVLALSPKKQSRIRRNKKMKRIAVLLSAVLVALAGCQTPAVAPPRPTPAPAPIPAPAPAPAPAVVKRDVSVQIEIFPGGPLELEKGIAPYQQAISGLRGIAIEPKDVVLTIRGDTLASDIEAGTPVSVITNLPRGLTARARKAVKGSDTITILVEGIPQVTLNESIRLFIPGSYLAGNEDFAGISNEAKFEILQGALSLTAHEAAQGPAADYSYIDGSLGSALRPVDIRITLTETALKETIEKEIPVGWVANLPSGLSASVRPAVAGATVLVLTIQGTPRAAKNEEAVSVVIPAEVLGDVESFAVPNEAIWWRIQGASIRTAVLIDGSVGSAITTKDLGITLEGARFAEDIAPGTAVSWITNLPAGLTARVKQARANGNTATITVAGTPTVISSAVLSVTIPASVLASRVAVPVVSNAEALFAINNNTRQISTSDMAGSSSNPHWLGDQVGPLNVPVIPAIKDFDGLGIVSVTAVAVERLGADNQYHWSGGNVNYGLLMEEARRLGAHAIVNVVLDYSDSVENSEVIRELADGHEWTQEELEKLAQGILREVRIGNQRHVVETSYVLTRTYRGTALAIKYKDGLNFYEAEKLRY